MLIERDEEGKLEMHAPTRKHRRRGKGEGPMMPHLALVGSFFPSLHAPLLFQFLTRCTMPGEKAQRIICTHSAGRSWMRGKGGSSFLWCWRISPVPVVDSEISIIHEVQSLSAVCKRSQQQRDTRRHRAVQQGRAEVTRHTRAQMNTRVFVQTENHNSSVLPLCLPPPLECSFD